MNELNKIILPDGTELTLPTGGGGSYDDTEIRGEIAQLSSTVSSLPTEDRVNALIDAKLTGVETLADSILEVL